MLFFDDADPMLPTNCHQDSTEVICVSGRLALNCSGLLVCTEQMKAEDAEGYQSI